MSSKTEDRLEFLEAEVDRLKFEIARSLNIDLSGRTPDANIPPQPERRITDQGRPVLEYAGPPATYATQEGPDSRGAPAALPPVEPGVLPGTSELIVDTGGGQGTGPLVEEFSDVDATDAAQRKADELGVNLADVKGTGADKRVTVADVEKHADKQQG